AVEAAWQSGIVVVVPGGNWGRDNALGTHGYGMISAPGNDPYAVTVGATRTMGTAANTDDRIASYSSKGPTLIDHVVKPDLVAPGNNVISLRAPHSTLDAKHPGNEVSGAHDSLLNPSYFSLSGTSMATPVVSGAVALVLQQNPSLTADQVKARLMKTADKMLFPQFDSFTLAGVSYEHQYDVFTVGAGYLDIPAALSNF